LNPVAAEDTASNLPHVFQADRRAAISLPDIAVVALFAAVADSIAAGRKIARFTAAIGECVGILQALVAVFVGVEHAIAAERRCANAICIQEAAIARGSLPWNALLILADSVEA
jgi:hypothetical protein